MTAFTVLLEEITEHGKISHDKRIIHKREGPEFVIAMRIAVEEIGSVPHFAADRVDDHRIRQEIPADAVRDDTDFLVKPEEGVIVMRLLDAIYKSAATGKPVEL